MANTEYPTLMTPLGLALPNTALSEAVPSKWLAWPMLQTFLKPLKEIYKLQMSSAWP